MRTTLLILAGLVFAPGLFAGPRGEILDRPPLFDWYGVRAGLGTSRSTQLRSYSFFATTRPLRSWQPGHSTSIDLRLEGTLGMLSEDREEAFTASLGPLLDVTFNDSRLHFIIGSSVTYLGDHTFGRLDLGSELQFVSSAGFDWELTESWTLGYRWQHISNAGISATNPGLNLNSLSLAFRF